MKFEPKSMKYVTSFPSAPKPANTS